MRHGYLLSTFAMIGLACAMLTICVMGHASAADTDSTWISDVAKNASDASAWDVAPASGSNLIFNAAHTGQCTIDQEMNFGTITLLSGSGMVVQGPVDFGYSDLSVNGGIWTGSLGNFQTCSGNLIQSGGSISSNVLSLIKTGSGKNIQVSNFNFYDLRIEGDTSILYDYAYVTHNIEIAAGTTLFNQGGLGWMPSFGNDTFVNNGSVTGTNNLLIMTTGTSANASLGTISSPVTISLANWGGPSDTVYLRSTAYLGDLTIWSANTLHAVTLDLNGHSLTVSSITIAAGGNVSSSSMDASLYVNSSIAVSEDGSLDERNITLVVEPHETAASDGSSNLIMIIIASVLGIVAVSILLLKRRRKGKK